MNLKLAISPCPNDTFMFDALINGRIDTEGITFETTFSDIENLNEDILRAGDKGPDISKISYAILPDILSRYSLLKSGSALGRGNGPIVIARTEIDLAGGSPGVAVPGLNTTANRLMEKVYPQLTDKTPVLFSEIGDRVAAGEFDAGVLIHEGRFTFGEKGLIRLSDLGEEWEKMTGLPLPLGAIVGSRRLDARTREKISRIISRSIRFAFDNPEVSADFVKFHAREMDVSVIRSHIDLFVNKYSLLLDKEASLAVSAFTGIAKNAIFD